MSTRNAPMTEEEAKTLRILALESQLAVANAAVSEATDSLLECSRVRDQWCAEFVKARNALKAIWDATDPYADGVIDASAHDKLCNEISSIARPWKDAQP